MDRRSCTEPLTSISLYVHQIIYHFFSLLSDHAHKPTLSHFSVHFPLRRKRTVCIINLHPMKSSSRILGKSIRSRQSTKVHKSFLTHVPSCLTQSQDDDEHPKPLLLSPTTPSCRSYHVSTRNDNATLVLGLSAIAVTAKAGQYAIKAWKEYQSNLPEESAEEKSQDSSESSSQSNATNGDSKSGTSSSSSSSSESQSEKRENIFAKYFDLGVGSKYYEGGFEDTMTRREAALILGVRESSTPQRIKEAHRKLLILNHPDTGGSTFLAGKINEAKELLLKGK